MIHPLKYAHRFVVLCLLTHWGWDKMAANTFKCIFLNENVWILIKISLKFVPKCPVNNIPALVQIVAWRRPGDKPLSEPLKVSLLMHIWVTQPQWVDIYIKDSQIHKQLLFIIFLQAVRYLMKRYMHIGITPTFCFLNWYIVHQDMNQLKVWKISPLGKWYLSQSHGHLGKIYTSQGCFPYLRNNRCISHMSHWGWSIWHIWKYRPEDGNP